MFVTIYILLCIHNFNKHCLVFKKNNINIPQEAMNAVWFEKDWLLYYTTQIWKKKLEEETSYLYNGTLGYGLSAWCCSSFRGKCLHALDKSKVWNLLHIFYLVEVVTVVLEVPLLLLLLLLLFSCF